MTTRRHLTEADEATIRHMRAKGYSYTNVAHRLDRKPQTVRAAAIRMQAKGWTRWAATRSERERAQAMRRQGQRVKDIAKALGRSNGWASTWSRENRE